MTRKEITESYKVLKDGVIASLGKFEGEMLYAPYFYGVTLDGCAEELEHMQDGVGEYIALVAVEPHDRVEFPELDIETTFIGIIENDQGFVSATELTDERAEDWRDECRDIEDESEAS